MGNPNKSTTTMIVYMCDGSDLSLREHRIPELPGYPIRGCSFADINASLPRWEIDRQREGERDQAGRRSLPNKNKQPLALHENSPCGNNPFSQPMPRRPKRRSANNGKSSAPSFDSSKGRMKPWKGADDIPLDEEDECMFAAPSSSCAYTDRNLHLFRFTSRRTSPRQQRPDSP